MAVEAAWVGRCWALPGVVERLGRLRARAPVLASKVAHKAERKAAMVRVVVARAKRLRVVQPV